jgi:exopolyphosphatase/pppGpp-phosphohydrolase
VAEAAMTVLDIKEADLCPWALRHGILLRRLDGLVDPAEVDDCDLIQTAIQQVVPRSGPSVVIRSDRKSKPKPFPRTS